ncbi:MAG: enoyl-CoA hydratase-related protein [Caulobacteraceae bacterium]
MAFQDIIYAADGPIGVITLNRPKYRNAQGYRMLDEIDAAFDLARANEDVRVVLVRGSGGVFSTGHDLGTPEGVEYRQALGAKPGIQTYDQFKKYNLDLLLKWRNFPKPTIAVVEGYCIYAGWMLAAAMDVIFAARRPSSWAGSWNTTPSPGTSASAAPRSWCSRAASSPPKRPRATAWSTGCWRRPSWSARASPGPAARPRTAPRRCAWPRSR